MAKLPSGFSVPPVKKVKLPSASPALNAGAQAANDPVGSLVRSSLSPLVPPRPKAVVPTARPLPSSTFSATGVLTGGKAVRPSAVGNVRPGATAVPTATPKGGGITAPPRKTTPYSSPPPTTGSMPGGSGGDGSTKPIGGRNTAGVTGGKPGSAKPKAKGKGAGSDVAAIMKQLGYGNSSLTDYINAALAPQLLAIKQEQNRTQQNYANQQATATDSYAALAKLLNGATGVQDVYRNAANDVTDYAKGFTGSAQDAGNAHIADLQNFLTNVVGADQGGAASIAAGNNPAAALHDSLYQIGGYNPATSLQDEGAAAGAGAANLPDYARLVGAQNVAQLGTEANKANLGFDDKRLGVLAQGPGIGLQYGAQRADAAAKAMGLSLDAQTLGLNDWYKHNMVGVAQQNADTASARADAAAARANATHFQAKVINGHAVTFDPASGKYYVPGTTTPVDPSSFRKPVKVTNTMLTRGRKLIQGEQKGYYSDTVSGRQISTGTLARIAKANKITLAQLTLQDPNLTPENIKKITDEIWVANDIEFKHTRQHDDPDIQNLYLSLVKEVGLPPRRAFQMVAKAYPQWGQAHSDYFK